MKSKTRLTIHKIEGLKSGVELWDTDVPGLHVRALKTGKFFYFYYRNKYGDQRKPSLGKYGAITLEGARKKARSFLEDLAIGVDPSLARKTDKQIENPTVHDLRIRWEEEHAYGFKSKSYLILHWDKHILPAIGDWKVRDITKREVLRILSPIKSNYTYNRVRSLLSKALNLAEEWEWREDFTNPVRKIKRRPEKTRRRYLKPDEAARLGKVLKKWEHHSEHRKNFARLILLLIYTGARRSEIALSKWSFVDWHREILDLPDSKTGAKEIILPEPAFQLLKEMYNHKTSVWIIPNIRNTGPLKRTYRGWKELCQKAQITDLRIHDLRHSFASTALSTADGTLQQVGELLGHADPKTTARYAHFMATPKRILADKTAMALDDWLNG